MIVTTGTHIRKLQIAWRRKPGEPRLLVGEIVRHGDDFRMEYNGPDFKEALEREFQGCPGLPVTEVVYGNQAMASLGSRNPDRRRPDYGELMKFWRIPTDADAFTVLGMTGGRLPTDTLEFLAEFDPTSGTDFITRIAGIDHTPFKQTLRACKSGDLLELQLQPSNLYDSDAIKVFWQGHDVGFIPRVHNSSIIEAIRAGLVVSSRVQQVKCNGNIHILANIKFE